MSKIIVLDTISLDGLALLDAAAPGVQYDVRTGLKGAELRQALQEYDGAICRSGVKITAEVLEGNRRLRAIVASRPGNLDAHLALAELLASTRRLNRRVHCQEIGF